MTKPHLIKDYILFRILLILATTPLSASVCSYIQVFYGIYGHHNIRRGMVWQESVDEICFCIWIELEARRVCIQFACYISYNLNRIWTCYIHLGNDIYQLFTSKKISWWVVLSFVYQKSQFLILGGRFWFRCLAWYCHHGDSKKKYYLFGLCGSQT